MIKLQMVDEINVKRDFITPDTGHYLLNKYQIETNDNIDNIIIQTKTIMDGLSSITAEVYTGGAQIDTDGCTTNNVCRGC